MTTTRACACDEPLTAATDEDYPDVFLAHVREAHPDWPFGDLAVRIVGEALLRLTGPTERLDEIGAVEVHPVMPDRLDDWLSFFDHDAFVDKPWVAGCYCIEQHCPLPEPALGVWKENRATMIDLFQQGKAYGYLAYVDHRPAGWVNAALRSGQLYAQGNDEDTTTVTISCFNIAPPYRGHSVSGALLDKVLADAPARGVHVIEGFPWKEGAQVPHFQGSLATFTSRGFEVLKTHPRNHHVVLKL